MEIFALLCILYQTKYGKKKSPLSSFGIFVKAIAVVKAELET